MPKQRHIPERSCVACGRKLAKRELIRVVRTPEGPVVIDPTGKTPGRGAYLCHSPDCWSKGLQKGGLERSLSVSFSPQDQTRLKDYYRISVAVSAPSER
ncbi:MAG: YlxR family protein [Chloroflexi bacterium]|nr:YlxR family protein [Chloroflexota bacterium]MCI0797434.1 YlxR family protein [Chloroflexota bacterium]MCI0877686.1 YlxR family protein [Chloroflexota bacterium]